MRVYEITNRIKDIETCRKYLKDWKNGDITDIKRIEALAEDIDIHLDSYIELLQNKEVK